MKGKPVYANALHPGLVDTNIFGQGYALWRSKLPSVVAETLVSVMEKLRNDASWSGEMGALTQIYLAAATDELVAKDIRGKYFHPQAIEQPANRIHATNLTLQKMVWQFTQELTDKVQ